MGDKSILEGIKEDFDLLVEKGNIAFYNTAEITYIFLIKDRKVLNVFTLVVFEESDKTSKKIPLTKEKLISINRNQNISLGICQERVSLDKAEHIFNNLLDSTENQTREWKINGDSIGIDKFKILSKHFIPSTDNNFQLNNVLKNNDENGSYILEFFSEEKNILINIINEKDYQKLCEEILKHLPIDLLFIKDRCSNIIFQFPICILSVDTTASDEWDGVKLAMGCHPMLKVVPQIEILTLTFEDDNIIGSGIYKGHGVTEKVIKSGSVDGEVTTLIKGVKTGLTLWYSEGHYLKHIHINSRISNYLSGPRLINLDGKENRINLESFLEERNISYHTKSQDDWINDRKYETSLNKLKEEKKFLQYGTKGANDRERALNDLKDLIDSNCEHGVYLWDPFADSLDILRTVYNCKYSNKEIKVINSFSKKTMRFNGLYGHEIIHNSFIHKLCHDFVHFIRNIIKIRNEKKKITFEDWKKAQIYTLKSQSNNKGINIEIRCQRRSHGWKFHDRFIIFPSRPIPRVWSLGTSINSIGNSHSILMEVTNPQNILDAFDELWNELDGSVLWKYPED